MIVYPEYAGFAYEWYGDSWSLMSYRGTLRSYDTLLWPRESLR